MSDAPPPNDDYGLPRRTVEWAATPCAVSYQRRVVHDEVELYVLIVDTGDNRNVTVWTREELERVLRNGLAFLGALPDGLIIAQPSDLRPT